MNMKKSMVVLVAILMLTSMAFAQTAEEIIAKYVKATGGEARYKAVKTTYAEGVFAMPAMGMEFKLKRYTKRPGKMKMEMVDEASGMSVVNVINGETGWMINSFMGISEPVEMDDATYKHNAPQADSDGFLFHREKNGTKVEYVGIEDKAGLKVHNVKITTKGGDETNAFFDVDSGILMGTSSIVEAQGHPMETETRMADYKEVDGLLIPHTITIMAQGMEMTMTISKIVQNEPIDDSIFVMPKSE